jgi:hypothetical protein
MHNTEYDACLCLAEALRRHIKFNWGNYVKPLNQAWLGLGTYDTYRNAVLYGYMEPVSPDQNIKYDQWWRLTPRGIDFIEKILSKGYTYDDNHVLTISGPNAITSFAKEFAAHKEQNNAANGTANCH